MKTFKFHHILFDLSNINIIFIFNSYILKMYPVKLNEYQIQKKIERSAFRNQKKEQIYYA
jgi:hypothetical protein